MTEKEKMLAGELYDPSDPELCAMRLRARKLTGAYNRSEPDEAARRADLLRRLFGTMGTAVLIEPDFHCDYGCHIHVGDHFYANFGCVILDTAEVRFGDHCMLGPQVGIYAATHPIRAAERNSGREYARPVRIGRNCWIGGHATINPGVCLGDDVVVASGAVVTKSFGSRVVVGGNPARVLKSLD